MKVSEFIKLSKQRIFPHCKQNNTSIVKHPASSECTLLFCNSCHGFASICYIGGGSDFGSSDLTLKTHALAILNQYT